MGERRLYLPTSNNFFSLIHRLSHVHFTRWTPEGILCTFSNRRALSTSMLSSTTTWVMPGLSSLFVCPPFCLIWRWNIWCLAFPIPAGRIYAVTSANAFPEIEKIAPNYNEQIIAVKYECWSMATTCDITFIGYFLCWWCIARMESLGSFNFRKGFHNPTMGLHPVPCRGQK